MNYFHDISFNNPSAFVLLAIPLLFGLWYWWKYDKIFPTLKLSSLEGFKKSGSSLLGEFKVLVPVARGIAFSLLVIAFARPQSQLKEENITTEGIDIMLTMDISGSMQARDLQPDRMEAAKQVAIDFVSGRPNDRIGMVVFAGEAYTQCPLTTDHAMLKKMILETKFGLVEDGTAIGMGLGTAASRLKDSEAKSKVVILMTDGENNGGEIAPLTASEIAMQYGLRVYTIGVGTIGMAPFPFQYGNRIIYQNVEVHIDEDLMRDIANKTGGKYFRATDNKTLKRIFDEIDAMEKSKIKIAAIQRVSEEFHPFVIGALALLLLEMLLRYVFLKSVP